ncbi:MAG: OmpW family outer membrane protein [Pseudomonadales bacterium]|nr:OmpW family outer membrane protein [Pseudomonadales bacterium]
MRLNVKYPLSCFVLATAALSSTGSGAAEAGDILVRVRGLGIVPTSASHELPELPAGSRLEADTAFTGEVDFTYMLTPRWGLELILATSIHDLEADGAIAGLGDIGEANLLPPTLTLQYHFRPQAAIRPYAGIGVNYTLFYDGETNATLDGALGPTHIDLGNSTGLALQAGVDIALTKGWFFNVDLKYIEIDTGTTLTSGALKRFTTVNIDPLVFGLGFGRAF